MIAYGRSCLFVCFLEALLFPANAQPLPEAVFYRESLNALLRNYRVDMGQNTRLYTGAEYIRNGQRAEGTPFFGSDTPVTGSVYYNDAIYQDLPFRYDLVSDEFRQANRSRNNRASGH